MGSGATQAPCPLGNQAPMPVGKAIFMETLSAPKGSAFSAGHLLGGPLVKVDALGAKDSA